MTGIEIIPTCVPRDANDLARGADAMRGYSDEIHIDIDDGLFAPVVTWPYTEAGMWDAGGISVPAGMRSEVHLMVEDPRGIGIAFARAGARRIVAHIEAFGSAEEAHGALDAWRENGAEEAGLGMLMATSFEVIEPVVRACDVVHLMSIATIGTQGIPYEASAPARIAEFHARHPDMLLSVDGGVGESNIADLVRAGARRFGVGSAISKAADPAAAYAKLKVLAESALAS